MRHGELGGDRLPHDDRPGRAKIPDHLRVALRDPTRVQRAAALCWRARGVEDVFHRDRHSHERAGRSGGLERGIHQHGVLRLEVDEGVDARLGLAVLRDCPGPRTSAG